MEEWTRQFEEFKVFKWIEINAIPEWEHISNSIEYLSLKNIIIDDTKALDQTLGLKKCLTDKLNDNEFVKKISHLKWVDFFSVSIFFLSCIDFYATIRSDADFLNKIKRVEKYKFN